MKLLVYNVLTLMTVTLSFQASHGGSHPAVFREEHLEKFEPGLKTGIEAVLGGNYQIAKKHLAPLAKQGHYGAQFLIADLAFHGKIQGYGYKEIKELYKASAEMGVFTITPYIFIKIVDMGRVRTDAQVPVYPCSGSARANFIYNVPHWLRTSLPKH